MTENEGLILALARSAVAREALEQQCGALHDENATLKKSLEEFKPKEASPKPTPVK